MRHWLDAINTAIGIVMLLILVGLLLRLVFEFVQDHADFNGGPGY